MRSLLKIIFIITLLELFVAGGGRLFEIGALTLRMILFLLNIGIISILYVYRRRIPRYVIVISVSVLVIFVFHTILGLANKAPLGYIAEDLKPLSYFFSILFFSYYIDSKARVDLIISLLKNTSLVMAIAYIIIQILFFLGKIDWFWFYNYANTQLSPSDFIFRGYDGFFFYKGFLYMIVGMIFWIHSPRSKKKSLAVLILAIAMILTGTRGFILMFCLLYGLFYGIPMILKLNVKMMILAGLVIFGSLYFFANMEIGDKNLSDSIRYQQLDQVFQDIGPISLFIGHGFGVGVPIRPVHMEIGYLETFHKQGILGLMLWGLFFLLLYNAYVKKKNFSEIRKSFFLAVLFVIILSTTNPFFNNPIGISMFMIALASLKVLNRIDESTSEIIAQKRNAP